MGWVGGEGGGVFEREGRVGCSRGWGWGGLSRWLVVRMGSLDGGGAQWRGDKTSQLDGADDQRRGGQNVDGGGGINGGGDKTWIGEGEDPRRGDNTPA